MNAIYARQSIDKKDSLSIEGQIELCKKLAGDEALVYQDKGFSGKNTKRPAFTELIAAIESGQISKVYVYRLDRFSRSIADFSRLWELLQKHNVEFVSVTENFDTSSPIGRAMLNIVLVFAQLERETIAERVKDNYIHRFRLGAWPGGPAPFGYDLDKTTDDGRLVSTLVSNDQAKIVKYIFEEYSQPDTSLRSIARELTSKGIHGPKREAWDNVTLSRLLHSPLYVRADADIYWYYLTKGLQVQQEVEAFDGIHACNVIGRRDRTKNKYNELSGQMLTVANHEGLVDSQLWLKVQDKLAGQPQIPRSMAGKYSWLTGLLKCSKCGYAVKLNYSRRENHLYPICSGRSNLSICNASIKINIPELEAYIGQKIKEMLEASPPLEVLPTAQESSKDALMIEQKIDRLVNALAESSEVSASYISKQIDKLHKEREALLAQMTPIHPKLQRLDFEAASFEEKKVIAAEFIERIEAEGKNVNIVWKV